MTTPQVLREVVSPALVRGVGYALLHSLWQGGALALLLAGALPLLRRHRAEVRYAASVVALAGLLLAAAGTFTYYYQSEPMPTEQMLSGLSLREQAVLHLKTWPAPQPAPPVDLLPALARQAEPYLPFVVVAWLLGLLLMGGRLAGGLLVASRLRRVGVQAIGADWQRRLSALASRAGVRRPVALLESARVAGPLVLGHLRPVILLPLGAVAGLSPALLEALLAHELAHIVRRDYLLNLALAVVEALFFYHPAVWFMANCLRAERENCCDDQAAALCGGDRLRVARALAALAELEAVTAATPHLALAAAGTGGRGSLLARVRRLALGRPQAPTLGEGLLAVLLGVLGVAGLSTGVALAAPAGNKLVKVLAANGKPVIAPADTMRKTLVVSAAPVITDVVRRQVRVAVASSPDGTPRVPTYSFSQGRPPRRERASTVVIEKDKKGRVVNLTVDGQPVDADLKGKKTTRSKKEKVRTVEVVRVPSQEFSERPERPERPEQPERPERSENQNFSLNLSMEGFGDQSRQEARRGLKDALRNPDLTSEQRRAMEKALRSLGDDKNFRQFDNQQFKLNFNSNGFATLNKNAPRQRLRYDIRTRTPDGLYYTDQAERAADRAAAQADRAAARADQEAAQADRAGERAEIAARRAELRARIEADAAELRALDGNGTRPPRAPRAPTLPPMPKMPPMPVMPPMPKMPPMPPAPPAAPNTGKLRDALRRDGLIKDEKHFSFELDDQGGRADGQALTPAQVAKYRQLLQVPTKAKGSKSNITVSVDED